MSFNSKDYKGFTFRSGPVKNKTKSYSSFWDNSSDVDVDEFLGNEVDKPKGKDLVALAGYKRAISNFVNIVTGENIPVVFNSKDDSYTDGKKVVIGSNIDEKKFDVAVGLALHEGSHIALSDFNLLKNLEIEIPDELFVHGESVGVYRHEVITTVKSLLNYIEDRRIDSFIFKTSPGYKGYYHSMYDKYFYSKQVDKGLLSSEFRVENIESYMFRIINLHNSNRQLGSLKGLKEIYHTIDLGSIQKGFMKDTREAFNTACEVMSIILFNIDKIETSDESEGNQNGSDGDSETSNGNGSGDSDNTITDEELEDMIENNSIGNGTPNDDGSQPVELSDRQKELLKKAFQKQEKFLDGDVQKTYISKKDSKDMSALEESGASYEQVGSDVPKYSLYGSSVGQGTKCLVVKKLTQALIDSGTFGCAHWHNQKNYDSDRRWTSKKYNFVEEGLRLGSILGRKLQVRGEESQLKFTRQDSGKIDKRLISELGFGNSNVFSHTITERYNKAYLHISVDASGSMSGKCWNEAMTSAIAMIKACDMAGNIDVVVSIRTTNHRTNGGNGHGVPLIMVCYDSRTDKLQKVKSLFSALDVDGTTPEGLCFEAIQKDLIPGNSNQDSYFINFSDGQPWFSNNEIRYCGSTAESHTKKMCDNMRAMGISVLSYFIGGDYECSSDMNSFKKMYGKDASFIKATNMMEVAKTMNRKFLEK